MQEAATGYDLQSTTNVAAPSSWTAVTNVPVVVGGEKKVTAAPAKASQFYRLKKP